MGIAIKKLEPADREAFEGFLKTDRKQLPMLKLAALAYPHEDMAVIAYKKEKPSLQRFVERHQFVLSEFDDNILSLSRGVPAKSVDHASYLFSGYTFYNGKMLIGRKEISENVADIRDISEAYGEFCTCVIGNGIITCSSDFFGMVPWFYFDNKQVFLASNNYHLMLLLLAEMQVELSMNIPRSRVNLITSGYTYGTVFSKELDISGCNINMAYETLNYSATGGLVLGRTSLWDILSQRGEWDEDLYEAYLFKAKAEIESNCKAAFEHPRFDKVVVDISGGFDSRVVFAAACNLPKRLRKKMYTHTRKSGTADDVEKASAVTNLYRYPKYAYAKTDTTELSERLGEINLDHISRTLGVYAVNSYLYTACYNDFKTLELTGYLGEVILGFMRCRGELDYTLGDRRLLARLGGCYLHNSVDELKEVFQEQETIINNMLDNYCSCDCLFKKFQQLYIDSRNRFICGSSHNIENNNMRIPMLFSKYALQAKWLYFNKFNNNQVPDEKVSMDLLNLINPLLATLPFAKNNDNVLPKAENLLNPAEVKIEANSTYIPAPKVRSVSPLYKDRVLEYMDNLETAEQMLLHIFDYSEAYYPVCLGLYKVLTLFKADPAELKTSHGRETIRKIYDIYYQIRLVEKSAH